MQANDIYGIAKLYVKRYNKSAITCDKVINNSVHKLLLFFLYNSKIKKIAEKSILNK